MITIRKIAFSTLLFAIAIQADAWTLFGSKEDALADKLRSGDKYLQKADAAYEEGQMERAGKYYGRAIQKYEKLQETDPTYMNGIAGLRLNYCAKQYTNALEAIEAALEAANAAEAESPDGAEVGAANAAEVGAADAAEVGTAGAAEVSKNQAAQPTQPQAAQAAQPQTAQAAKPQAAQPTQPQAAQPTQPQAAQAAQPQAAQPPQPQAAQAAQPQAAQAAQPQAAPPPKPPYDPRNFAHDFAEARMLMEDGNLSEAAAVLIPMLRHDPSNRQVRLLLAIVRTRQSRYDEAIVALEDLRGIREDMPILLALSGAYMGALRYHDALLALDRAVRLNPADPNPYINLAWLTLMMPHDSDTLKNAEIYYRQAVKRGAARDRGLESRIGLTKW